jgi:pimeloyl-[acyl-carrier protein] methyl ester esterase
MRDPESKSILWLPGWSAPVDLWQPALEATAAASSGATNVLCDFASCTRADDMLETAHTALADTAGAATVVGWSLGALVALELAGAAPGRIGRLVLVGATDRFVVGTDGRGGWPERVLRRMQTRLRHDAEATLEAFDGRMFSSEEREAGAAERWAALRAGKLPPLASLEAGLDYLCHFSAQPDRVAAPVFLLHGTADSICPADGAQRLAEALPRASLTLWDGAGHAPFWTRPDAFSHWLSACLA